MIVFGILLVLVLPFARVFGESFSVLIVLAVVFAAGFLFSLLLLLVGRKRRNVIQRLSRYSAMLSGQKTVLKVDDIAAETGFAPSLVRQDMKRLKQWQLHFDLYLDTLGSSIMKGKDTYRQYLECERLRVEREKEEAERARKMTDPKTASLEVFRAEGLAAVDKIRAANILLPGEEISTKLSKLEKTMKRIFDHVAKHPEKLSETRRLMNYHLPTTLKLVEKYCQYDVMDFQPENVKNAKAEIEQTLEMAEAAFSNFLETLFHDDTLDITTDAEVLKQMLEQEGLTGRKFEAMGPQE
jgi:hypothetical protein